MAVRNIVEINEELCNGCGLCVSACAEGAIQMVDGKAKVVKDEYCDGLGACLGECPQGAITIIEREAPEFDEAAVEAHLTRIGRTPAHTQQPPIAAANRTAMLARIGRTPAHTQQPAPAAHQGGCPGSMMRQFAAKPAQDSPAEAAPSELRQWPVQLHLVPPTAPYFRDADLLLAADCAAFACGDFHRRFMQDHAIAIACPKLDNADGYVEKLADMITKGGLRSITIVRMQVPCCGGLERLAQVAVTLSGKDVPIRRVVLGLEGDVLEDNG